MTNFFSDCVSCFRPNAQRPVPATSPGREPPADSVQARTEPVVASPSQQRTGLQKHFDGLAELGLSGLTRDLFEQNTRPDAPISTAHLSMEPGSKEQLLDRVATSFLDRNLALFHQRGGAAEVAKSLFLAEKPMLVTGFNVMRDEQGNPIGETDGPGGAASVYRALQLAGKEPVIVTNSASAAGTRAALRELGVSKPRIVVFQPAPGESEDAAAKKLLDKTGTDEVFMLEVPGGNHEGDLLNMRGLSVADINAPRLESLLLAAKERNIMTLAGGDGGNESGLGGIVDKVPLPANGANFRAAVPAGGARVTAWNSNLAGHLVAAHLLRLIGLQDRMHTGAQEANAIKAMTEAGLVDGVNKRPGEAGVDGFPPSVHSEHVEAIRAVLGMRPQVSEKDGHVVFLFDSGNGGLLSLPTVLDALNRSGHDNVQLVLAADHGRSPYGNRPLDGPEGLRIVVQDVLKVGADQIQADVLAAVCNTAGTVFGPQALGGVDVAQGIKPEVLNLLDSTAAAIVEHPEVAGDRPAFFSTARTNDSLAYQDRVKKLSGGKTSVHGVGCPNWATLVDEGLHLSKDPAVQAKVKAEVQKHVDQLLREQPDTTSVWLNCTHYPALAPVIRECLLDAGRPHIKVIDPMPFQAERLVETLNRTPTTQVRPGTSILTSGDKSPVRKTMVGLMPGLLPSLKKPEMPSIHSADFRPPWPGLGAALDAIKQIGSERTSTSTSNPLPKDRQQARKFDTIA